MLWFFKIKEILIYEYVEKNHINVISYFRVFMTSYDLFLQAIEIDPTRFVQCITSSSVFLKTYVLTDI